LSSRNERAIFKGYPSAGKVTGIMEYGNARMAGI